MAQLSSKKKPSEKDSDRPESSTTVMIKQAKESIPPTVIGNTWSLMEPGPPVEAREISRTVQTCHRRNRELTSCFGTYLSERSDEGIEVRRWLHTTRSVNQCVISHQRNQMAEHPVA